MKLGKDKPKVRYKRFWLGLVGVVLVVFVCWAIWQLWFAQTPNPRTHSPTQPSVAQQPLRPSSYQQTRSRFGPWKLAAPNSTGAPRLVMLHANGGVDVSSKVISNHRNWKKASAIEIVAVVAGSRTVRIRTTDNRLFSLNYGQAFVLAQRPDAVYCFLHNGPGKSQLVSSTVDAIKTR